jgi:hypothetical protein
VEKDEKGKNFSLYTRIKWEVHSKCRVKSIIIVVGGKNFSKLFHYPTHMICNSKHDPLFCVFAKKNIYISLLMNSVVTTYIIAPVQLLIVHPIFIRHAPFNSLSLLNPNPPIIFDIVAVYLSSQCDASSYNVIFAIYQFS